MNLSVGILFAPCIHFILEGNFREKYSGQPYSGEVIVSQEDGKTFIETAGHKQETSLPLHFVSDGPAPGTFELTDVTIGINFHWERKENQRFKGELKIIQEDAHLTAINILDIEEYLQSVISSEMSATSSAELLKAHAVISRSWLLAQQEKNQSLQQQKQAYQPFIQNQEEYIRWFDREDHLHFDVCADDHCQRYQGINKATTPSVYEAVQQTAGEVLCYNRKICDARFSKCCGGIAERFENVWEPVNHPYLKEIYDASGNHVLPDLTQETQVTAWINSTPEAFCNTTDKAVLSQVLNDYDQETRDFFRWEVYYTQEEISQLIQDRLALDFGKILDLIPVERGVSGRLIKLKVVGSHRTLTIGKELIIRKAFSHSHLYSSAFIVEKEEENGKIKGFRLKGAGWGHGVGLCQIGAAVMGAQGYSYRDILFHYFPGASIEKKY